MAATSVCQIANTIFGNMAVRVYSVTVGADCTTAFDTGMSTILYHTWSQNSCTTASGIQVFKNQIADGTETSGYVAVTGGTDGDTLTVVVFAKH